MMSTNNILSPANGKPIIVPSQDIILGLYYMSLERENEQGEGMVFANVQEILLALGNGSVSLHAKVKARVATRDENGERVSRVIETTPGRAQLADLLPDNPNCSFDLVNKLMTKKQVSDVIDHVYRHCGQKDTVIFCDRLMALGFGQACNAGISFGIADLTTPDLKEKYCLLYTSPSPRDNTLSRMPSSA